MGGSIGVLVDERNVIDQAHVIGAARRERDGVDAVLDRSRGVELHHLEPHIGVCDGAEQLPVEHYGHAMRTRAHALQSHFDLRTAGG